MGSNGVSTHEIICNECILVGTTYEVIYKITLPLLKRFAKGRSIAERNKRIANLVVVEVEKKPTRTTYIDMVKNSADYSIGEMNCFCWAVACSAWVGEKAFDRIAEMEMIVEDGKELGQIVNDIYLAPVSKLKTDTSMQQVLSVSNGKYYKMKKDAVTLFGLQMYKYALRREKEDIENGIMDPIESK